ncbi:hypothetical protein [Thalassobacillus sp. C254]|uniref:hypothetical protein n=1 Tax=Thalassobacillus sp. C254 TaxID=1225341 RepID=UPI0012EDFF72|nr:hypothetical protein [Thalassobacillus sp. C254]
MIRKEAGKIEMGNSFRENKRHRGKNFADGNEPARVKSLVEMVCFERVRKTGGIE